MSSSNLIRLGGMAAVVGGVLWLAGGLIALMIGANSQDPASFSSLVEGIFTVAFIGTLAGIAGLHVRQASSYGLLGTAGSVAAFTGIASMSASTGASALIGPTSVGNPILDSLFFLGFLIAVVGFVLLGIATLRVRVLPRWCGILLILFLPVVAALGASLGGFGAGIVQGTVWLALGYLLWSERSTSRSTSTQRTSRVS